MGVNKVVFGGETVVDLTSDTVTADKLVQGVTAHNKSGVKITGTLSELSDEDVSIGSIKVKKDVGKGVIEVAYTIKKGYVSSDTTFEGHGVVNYENGKTITPTTSDITAIKDQYFAVGDIVVKGDVNLNPTNIKSGVSIFGVEGSLETDGGGATSEMKVTTGTFTGTSVTGLGFKPTYVSIVAMTNTSSYSVPTGSSCYIISREYGYLNNILIDHELAMRRVTSSNVYLYGTPNTTYGNSAITFNDDGFSISLNGNFDAMLSSVYSYTAIG